MDNQIINTFTRAFRDAGGHSVLNYCDFIRCIAIMCVILAIIWSMGQFLSAEAKESDGFMPRLGSRSIRLMLGLMFFILFLTI